MTKSTKNRAKKALSNTNGYVSLNIHNLNNFSITCIRQWCSTHHAPSHDFEDPQRGINTLRPKQNGCHFAGDIFKHIFLDNNAHVLIEISLRFVSKGPNDNKVQIGFLLGDGLTLNRQQAMTSTNDGSSSQTLSRVTLYTAGQLAHSPAT